VYGYTFQLGRGFFIRGVRWVTGHSAMTFSSFNGAAARVPRKVVDGATLTDCKY
jgi:hypothetical protein